MVGEIDTVSVSHSLIRLIVFSCDDRGNTAGKDWACGKAALAEMENLALSVNHVECDDRGQDGHGRQLSVCRADGQDVEERLVQDGLAWSFRKYSHDYDADEEDAHHRGIGVWQAETETPWDFRAHKWDIAIQTVPDGRFPIKGNINDKGERIYHAP